MISTEKKALGWLMAIGVVTFAILLFTPLYLAYWAISTAFKLPGCMINCSLKLKHNE